MPFLGSVGTGGTRTTVRTNRRMPMLRVFDQARGVQVTPPANWTISTSRTLFSQPSIATPTTGAPWLITDAAFGIPGPLTMEMWIYFTATPPDGSHLMGLKAPSNPDGGFTAFGGASYYNEIGLSYTSPSGQGGSAFKTPRGVPAVQKLTPNTWNHIAIVFTPVVSNQQTGYIWFNGEFQASYPTHTFGGVTNTFPQHILLGGYFVTNTVYDGISPNLGQIRLSNILRYPAATNDITVPTAPWTTDANTVSLIGVVED